MSFSVFAGNHALNEIFSVQAEKLVDSPKVKRAPPLYSLTWTVVINARDKIFFRKGELSLRKLYMPTEAR